MKSLNVGVVGAGYVGLVTGACLAHLGHRVVCVDREPERIAGLTQGRVPFYEPGIEKLMQRDGGNLSFTLDLPRMVQEADVVFIAVGTPQGEDGSADLSGVGTVARSVGRALAKPGRLREHPLVVVNKSTVPIGSGDYVSMLVREGIGEAGGAREAEFLVASNPEFLREGSAIYDSLFPDRIVVGVDSRDSLDVMRALYEPIIQQTFRPGSTPARRPPCPS